MRLSATPQKHEWQRAQHPQVRQILQSVEQSGFSLVVFLRMRSASVKGVLGQLVSVTELDEFA
jgi:hypothetical protein